jgi:hypothetical protein
MKVLILIIASLALGITIGNLFPIGEITHNSVDAQKYHELQAKFEQLSQVDIEEYIQLKNQKEKYEKADEIFGKILTIFLYDLGIRASHKQLNAIKQSALTSTTTPSKLEEPPQPAIVRAQNDQPTLDVIKTPSREWTQHGKQARELYTESEVKEFLEKVEIKDFFSELKSARSLTAEQIGELNGSYLGEVVFDDKSKANWHVEMTLNGRVVNNELRGRSRIVLSENGKVFSTSRDRGKPKNIQGFAGDDNAFLISVYNDKGYMQLYNMERMNMLSGLLYLSNGVGQFSKVGTVILRKR